MARVTWDQVGERRFETGVDRGVLFDRDANGDYVDGVPWNGLTTVTESPSGAESNKQYADNIVYLNLISAEEFGATIEAFTYPDEFAKHDGTAVVNGVQIGQQGRKTFGLVYRTKLGNDVDGVDFGYKLHLVYGALAAPSEKGYSTINDSPEALAFSWEVSTTPVEVPGNDPVTGKPYKPTALLTITSTDVPADDLAALEDIIYGTEGDDPRMPLPEEVLTLFGTGVTTVDLGVAANQPTYNAGTHVITLPAVAGVQWQINGEDAAPGAQPALAFGETAEVTAHEQDGYNIEGDDDWTFDY